MVHGGGRGERGREERGGEGQDKGGEGRGRGRAGQGRGGKGEDISDPTDPLFHHCLLQRTVMAVQRRHGCH